MSGAASTGACKRCWRGADMNARFADLSRRLLRGGIARHHVQRVVAELEAHFADLVAELRAAGLSKADSETQAALRLGSDEAVAASFIARPELRAWARQWPSLAFVVLPLLALVVRFVLSMLASVGVFTFSLHVLGMTPGHPGAVAWVVGILQAYAVWIAPVLAAGGACVLAARTVAPVIWPILGSLLVALVGAATNASLEWSPAVPKGLMSGGIGVRFPDVDPVALLRVTLTLVIVLVPFAWHRSRARDLEREIGRASCRERV